MRGGVVAGHDLVEGIDRPEVEIRLAAQLAADLEHVPLELLESKLHPGEKGIERLCLSRKIRLLKIPQRGCIPILRAPQTRDLFHAPRGPLALRPPVLLNQLAC